MKIENKISTYNVYMLWTAGFVVLMAILMSCSYNRTYYTKLPVEVVSQTESINKVIDLKEGVRKATFSLNSKESLSKSDQSKMIKMLGGNKLDNMNNTYLFSDDFIVDKDFILKEADYKQAYEYRVLQKDAFAWTWIFLILAGFYAFIVSYMLSNKSRTKGIHVPEVYK